ncbi:N-formylglutamate amidohydrolase [compost metagenome]
MLNGRFKGGHITRHYGDPAKDIHAVQLELAQSTYMEEVEPFKYREDLAAPTQVVLKQLLETMLAWGCGSGLAPRGD